MMRAALLAFVLAASACGDSFERPPHVDRSKPPYDFSVWLPEPDGGVPDLLEAAYDLAGAQD